MKGISYKFVLVKKSFRVRKTRRYSYRYCFSTVDDGGTRWHGLRSWKKTQIYGVCRSL